jgi:hypothetical protein
MALSPGEIAVHPTDGALARASAYVLQFSQNLRRACTSSIHGTETISEETCFKRTAISIGGDEKIGLYEPRHPSPIAESRKSSVRPKVKNARQKPSKKIAKKKKK